jgi:hypothetical protein
MSDSQMSKEWSFLFNVPNPLRQNVFANHIQTVSLPCLADRQRREELSNEEAWLLMDNYSFHLTPMVIELIMVARVWIVAITKLATYIFQVFKSVFFVCSKGADKTTDSLATRKESQNSSKRYITTPILESFATFVLRLSLSMQFGTWCSTRWSWGKMAVSISCG